MDEDEIFQSDNAVEISDFIEALVEKNKSLDKRKATFKEFLTEYSRVATMYNKTTNSKIYKEHYGR